MKKFDEFLNESNMSYIRFENTYKDLSDCYDNFIDDDLSESEKEYRKNLIELCKNIVDNWGDYNFDFDDRTEIIDNDDN